MAFPQSYRGRTIHGNINTKRAETTDSTRLCHTPAHSILNCFVGAKSSTCSRDTYATGTTNMNTSPIPATRASSLKEQVQILAMISGHKL